MKCKICGHLVTESFDLDKGRIAGKLVKETKDTVPYYRCSNCKFLFTPYLDGFSVQQLNEQIYNEEYWKEIDPLDRSNLPLRFVERFFVPRNVPILDYGCAAGKGVTALLKRGYDAYGFDIASEAAFDRPDRCFNSWQGLPKEFDFIFSFEVLEHLVNPLEFFDRADQSISDDGVVFISTYLFDEAKGRDFWYIAPRNGHISIFSRETFAYLSARYHFEYTSMFRPHLHCLHRRRASVLWQPAMKLKYAARGLWQKLVHG